MRKYNRAEHEHYREGMHIMFGGGNHPEPDLTRCWVDVSSKLPGDLFERALQWAGNLTPGAVANRPGAYVLDRASPGAIWSNSDTVATALGRELEPAVSRALGQPALMSYGGLVCHSGGTPLVRHRDLGFHHYLLSWPIRHDAAWPLHIEKPDGLDTFDNFRPERGLLFCGRDVHHYRNPYPGECALTLYLRYTVFEHVRLHTQREIDVLSEAGLRELLGQPVGEDARAAIRAECTAQDVVNRSRSHFALRGLLGELKDGAMPDDLQGRLRRAVACVAPGMMGGCTFAGHEHRLAIGMSSGLDAWCRDLSENEAYRQRAVVCVNRDCFSGIELRSAGLIEMEPGDALVIRCDEPFRWAPSSPQLTAVYGAPEDLLARTAAASEKERAHEN